MARRAGIRSPFELDSDEFNRAAERYYREDLRRRHMDEAFGFLAEDLPLADCRSIHAPAVHRALQFVLGGQEAADFLARVRGDAVDPIWANVYAARNAASIGR